MLKYNSIEEYILSFRESDKEFISSKVKNGFEDLVNGLDGLIDEEHQRITNSNESNCSPAVIVLGPPLTPSGIKSTSDGVLSAILVVI